MEKEEDYDAREEISIKCCDGKGLPPYDSTVGKTLMKVFSNNRPNMIQFIKQLDWFMDPNNDKKLEEIRVLETFTYRNIVYETSFNGLPGSGIYCGYVRLGKSNLPEEILEKINEESEQLDSKIYIPHGDYTAFWGFDCSHAGDLAIGQVIHCNKDPTEGVFRTRKYVKRECKKIIDSVIDFIRNSYQ